MTSFLCHGSHLEACTALKTGRHLVILMSYGNAMTTVNNLPLSSNSFWAPAVGKAFSSESETSESLKEHSSSIFYLSFPYVKLRQLFLLSSDYPRELSFFC